MLLHLLGEIFAGVVLVGLGIWLILAMFAVIGTLREAFVDALPPRSAPTLPVAKWRWRGMTLDEAILAAALAAACIASLVG